MPVMPRRRFLGSSTRATDGDAAGLARIMQCGWYKEVQVKSVSCHEIRAVLSRRAQLVKIKRDLENQIRGLARRTSVWSSARRAALSSAAGSRSCLAGRVFCGRRFDPLLEVREKVRREIAALYRKLLGPGTERR